MLHRSLNIYNKPFLKFMNVFTKLIYNVVASLDVLPKKSI